MTITSTNGTLRFEGSSGPSGVLVAPNTDILWSTDGSIAYAGWELCFEPSPPHPPSSPAPPSPPPIPPYQPLPPSLPPTLPPSRPPPPTPPPPSPAPGLPPPPSPLAPPPWSPPAPRWPWVPGDLWAITTSSHCAESLAYGPGANWDGQSPFVCTDCMTQTHNTWEQVFTDDGSELFRMTWLFSSVKTLQQRFDDATTVGEPVTWMITELNGAVHSVEGTWRWSSSSGGWPIGVAGSSFSGDDGCWAAGSYVDGGSRCVHLRVLAHCQKKSLLSFLSCGCAVHRPSSGAIAM